MTAASFNPWFDWMETAFEGTPLHRTAGDDGADTAWGWTYRTWIGFAHLHNLDASFAHFRTMGREDFRLPTRMAFWNMVQADRLPAGADFIWADFQFTSFHASEVLQAVLGVTADNVVGDETVGAAIASAARNINGLLGAMTFARKEYYKTLPAFDRFGNGWNRRADECEVQALLLANPTNPEPTV